MSATLQDGQVPERLSVVREEVTDAELTELGVALASDFPGSTAADFRRYPVLSEGGWFLVVKHQPSLRPGAVGLLGPITPASTGLDIG